MSRIALLLAPLFLLVAAPAARAVPITYEFVILLQPGDELVLSAGGPTFDDTTFTPNGVVAATGFEFEHYVAIEPPATFSLGGCTALAGHVDATGTKVVALSGTCNADNGASAGILTFSSDNTATIAVPAAVLLLNATYTLVPEPGTGVLVALGGFLALALRRKA